MSTEVDHGPVHCDCDCNASSFNKPEIVWTQKWHAVNATQPGTRYTTGMYLLIFILFLFYQTTIDPSETTDFDWDVVGIIIIWRTIVLVHCTTTTTTTLNIRIHIIMAHETKQNCSQTWRICQSSHFLLDPCRSIHDTPYCTNSHTFPPKCLFECRQYASLPVVWHVFSVHGRGAYILHKVPSSKRNERNECE